MDKVTLINVHSFLAEVLVELEDEDSINDVELDNNHFEEYKELGVGPSSAHGSKKNHKRAVILLSKSISGEFDSEERDDETEEMLNEVEEKLT